MFYIEILDDYGSIDNTSEHDTLDDALREIEDRIMHGINPDLIDLKQSIPFKVEVKATLL